jgi:hypothetical protein
MCLPSGRVPEQQTAMRLGDRLIADCRWHSKRRCGRLPIQAAEARAGQILASDILSDTPRDSGERRPHSHLGLPARKECHLSQRFSSPSSSSKSRILVVQKAGRYFAGSVNLCAPYLIDFHMEKYGSPCARTTDCGQRSFRSTQLVTCDVSHILSHTPTEFNGEKTLSVPVYAQSTVSHHRDGYFGLQS